jgi:hypothetical protein
MHLSGADTKQDGTGLTLSNPNFSLTLGATGVPHTQSSIAKALKKVLT